MNKFEKAFWHTDNEVLNISVPISKIDRENRTVSGFATLDNVDKQGDVVTLDASLKAFETFRGNVREMHQPIAVGKLVSFNPEKFYDPDTKREYKGIYVKSYISKGAQDTWEKILDGTLNGFSIGGKIKKTESAFNSDLDKNIRIVNEYELQELSLVDNPANQHANILTIEKNNDGTVTYKGMLAEMSLNNVHFCSDDNLVIFSQSDDSHCPACEKRMINIGFIESNEKEKTSAVKFLINKYMSFIVEKTDGVKVGDFVSWNLSDRSSEESSGDLLSDLEEVEEFFQKAENVKVGDHVLYAVPKPPGPMRYGHGSVSRIATSGTVRLSGTNESIEATEDNPVAVIRVWAIRDGQYIETDREVARPISTLRVSEQELEKASSKVMETLKDKASSHNNDVGDVSSKRTSARTLAAVFDRGIGAYRTNPGSVRPNVTSEEQWAYARVNGFLRALRTGKFPRSPYDTDLLPEGHPLASKAKKSVDISDDSDSTGKVIRVVRNGSISIPNSSSTIDATEDDPAVLIAVYKRGSDGWNETDTVVGHKMTVLTKISPLSKSENFEDDKNIDVKEDIMPDIENNSEEIVEESVEESTEEVVESEEVSVEEIVKNSDNEEVKNSETNNSDSLLAASDFIVKEITASLKGAFQEEIKSYTDSVLKSVLKRLEDFDAKINELENSTKKTFDSVENIKSNVEKFEHRVEAVEADTAVRKSGDLGGVVQEQKIVKSLWDGRFLGSADLYR